MGTGINDQVANLIVAQLLYLDSLSASQPINMYINSPGGSIYAGMAIYDTMQMIKAPVSTMALGITASMGTALLCSGARGKRYALPHATVHLHPAGGGAQGYTEDVKIQFHEQQRLETQLFHLIGKHTNHNWKDIKEDFLRDKYMSAFEAQQYGLVDEVLGEMDHIIALKPGVPTVLTLSQLIKKQLEQPKE